MICSGLLWLRWQCFRISLQEVERSYLETPLPVWSRSLEPSIVVETQTGAAFRSGLLLSDPHTWRSLSLITSGTMSEGPLWEWVVARSSRPTRILLVDCFHLSIPRANSIAGNPTSLGDTRPQEIRARVRVSDCRSMKYPENYIFLLQTHWPLKASVLDC